MDTLIAVIFVLVLGLAVAQFFIMSGAFKKRGKGAGGDASGGSPVVMGGAETHKSKVHDGNSSDSSDSGGDGGGDGGGGGGE